MWRMLKARLKTLLWPQKVRVVRTWRSIDFTQATPEHWIEFNGGSNYDALFSIRGAVKMGDEIIVRMQSGLLGRYRLFSVVRDFTGVADWKARGVALGYCTVLSAQPRETTNLEPKIKGLLSDGTRGVRPSSSESPALPSGFTEPASEFWKVLCRDEACHRRTNNVRTTDNL